MEIIQSFLTLNPCYTANINKADSRYVNFQKYGPKGGMLHSVGTPQPDALVFVQNWNKPTYTRACVHAFIDANSGVVMQTLPWNFRGWHCAGTGNNTHIGVEMCETRYIKYISGAKFEVLDRTRAVADCQRTYHSAVELFAMLAVMWNWNVDTDILSHKEGGIRGIASGHVDPEHYWSGLGMPYTMDGFRADVKRKIEENRDMTRDETIQLIKELFPGLWDEQYDAKMQSLSGNSAGKWSKEGREWAIDNGLINGVGVLPDGSVKYAWKSPVTREQLATILMRNDSL